MKRPAAILTGPSTHLDHLGVLCALLRIPLIVTEEETYALAKTFYPDLNVSLTPLEDLTLEFLATHFDILFETGKFWALELRPLLHLLYGKRMRFVFCPHGNSDKGHSLSTHIAQDVSLFYGEHMRHLLEKSGATLKIEHLVRTGNYRLLFYQAHKPFYDALAHREIFSRLSPQRKTILYAPTWQDRENPSSFLSACETLICQLSGTYNLLIKLHPFLEEDHPATALQLLARYEHCQGVLFIQNFPAIYPLLARTDIYLGDFSSIGYDFLYFDRPLFFLGTKPTSSFPLRQCGLEIPPEDYPHIKRRMEAGKEHFFSEKRKEIYAYAFGEEKRPEQLRKELEETASLHTSACNKAL